MTELINFITEFSGVSQHWGPQQLVVPMSLRSPVCPQRVPAVLPAAITGLLPFLAQPPSGRTSSHGAFLLSAGGDRRGSWDTELALYHARMCPRPR